MSPGRKNHPLKRPRKTHTSRRHAKASAEPRRPIDSTTEPCQLAEWSKLGAELAARGPYRLGIAAHAARAAASGGASMPLHEEEQIAEWFIRIVNEAIRRGGGSGDNDDVTAVAIWLVLIGDWHRSPESVCTSRCPAVAAIPGPVAADFLASLRVAAAGYVHTAVAGASEDDIADLRCLPTATADDLEAYRPWGLVDTEDSPASALLEPALASLTLRHPTHSEICGGFAAWGQGFVRVALDHTLSPVERIGAIAWLALVALRDEEHAA